MTDRVPCTCCGKLILPSTAEKTGGLCMPCKGGYRKNIEESIRRQEEERQYRASPPWKHWVSLVDRVHKTPAGFSGLSLQEQKFFALRVLVGEVYNGGFDQYFSNSSGDYYVRTIEALAEIGATESLRILLQAKTAIFGENSVPSTQAERFSVSPKMPDEDAPSPEWWNRLEALDKEFWKDPDGIDSRIEQYAIDNALRKDF